MARTKKAQANNPLKKECLKKGEDVNDFKIINSARVPPPQGLTPEILRELWLLLAERGAPIPNRGQTTILFRTDNVILTLSKSHDNGRVNFCFGVEKPRNGNLNADGARVLLLANGVSVVWDRGLPTATAANAIKDINIAKAPK